MSRRYPTLEQFENNQDKVKTIEIQNGEPIKKISLEKADKDTLLELQKVTTESMYKLTDAMRDRSFYYYDDKSKENHWIRVFEHLNLDIAVRVNIYYMFDEESPVVSFPNYLKYYNHSGNSYDKIVYKFPILNGDSYSDEELKQVGKDLKFGIDEIVKTVDSMVYAL